MEINVFDAQRACIDRASIRAAVIPANIAHLQVPVSRVLTHNTEPRIVDHSPVIVGQRYRIVCEPRDLRTTRFTSHTRLPPSFQLSSTCWDTLFTHTLLGMYFFYQYWTMKLILSIWSTLFFIDRDSTLRSACVINTDLMPFNSMWNAHHCVYRSAGPSLTVCVFETWINLTEILQHIRFSLLLK